MSWLCFLTFSCLANPAVPVILPAGSDIEVFSAAPEVRPVPSAKSPEPSVRGPAASVGPLSCELHQVRRDGAQVVLAAVRANVSVEGVYEFEIGTQGAGQASVSSLTGDRFQIRAGEEVKLKGPSLDLGRDVILDGRLELRNRQGKMMASCTL